MVPTTPSSWLIFLCLGSMLTVSSATEEPPLSSVAVAAAAAAPRKVSVAPAAAAPAPVSVEISELLAAPHQLLYPDGAHTQLLINETTLELLSHLTESVAVVGIVGPFHSGKSFLLNQLLGKTRGFRLGSQVDPETRGLWAWAKQMRVGTPPRETTVLLLDSEGFFASGVSEEYDAQIFAVASLLSSRLLYNTVKVIDSSAIDKVDLLARRTSLFGLLTAMQQPGSGAASTLPDSFRFPHLHWIVEDFVQDLGEETATEWLLRLLKESTFKMKATDHHASVLTSLFPSITAHTIFLPSADKQDLMNLDTVPASKLLAEYQSDVALLRREVFDSLEPKRTADGTPLNGAALGTMLRMLVQSANTGSFPDLPSQWTAFVERQREKAHDDCSRFFRRKFALARFGSSGAAADAAAGDSSPSGLDASWRPQTQTGMRALYRTIAAEAEALFRGMLFGLEDLVVPGLVRLKAHMGELSVQYVAQNTEHIQRLVDRVAERAEDSYSLALLEGLSLPCVLKKLEQLHQQSKLNAIAVFDEEMLPFSASQGGVEKGDNDHYAVHFRRLTKAIEGHYQSRLRENEDALASLHRAAIAEATATYGKLTALTNPITTTELADLHAKASAAARTVFVARTEAFAAEKPHDLYASSLVGDLHALLPDLHKRNEAIVEKKARAEVRACVRIIKENFAVVLPIMDNEMQHLIETTTTAVLAKYHRELSPFSDAPSFNTQKRELQEELLTYKEDLFTRNIKELHRASVEPRQRARDRVERVASQYSNHWLFTRTARAIALEELAAETMTEAFREKVVDLFLAEDCKKAYSMVQSQMMFAYGIAALVVAASVIGVLACSSLRSSSPAMPAVARVSRR